MNKEVEFLKKNDVEKYIEFIKEVFGNEVNKESILKLLENNKILIIKIDEKIVASATLEERFEYIKNKKYYFISYLGVMKEYRREGYASKIFDKIEELDSKIQEKEFKIKDTTVFVKFYN